MWRDENCVPSDLDQLLAAEPASDSERLQELTNLYRGDLLEGCNFGPMLDGWLGAKREELRDHFLDLVLPISGMAGSRALPLLRRLSADLPEDERVERALLLNISLTKPMRATEQEFRRFSDTLRREIGSEPSLELRMFASSLGTTPELRPASQSQIATGPMRKKPNLPRLLILPPITDDGRNRTADRVAASLVDDVTFGLCRLRSFSVIAPHTARMISRGALNHSPPPQADYVLFTRLLPDAGDGEYRFGFSLARSDTSEVLVGDQLRFTLEQLPARHADLSRLVTSIVASEIEKTELAAFRLGNDPTAYVYYLLGQERLRMVDLPDLRAARRAFRHALSAEPKFAPAMSMVARTLSLEWLVIDRGDDSLLAEASRLARRAIEEDPLDPSGYRELGNAALYSHDLEASLEYSTEARARAPHHADVLLDHADSLVHYGRYLDAKTAMDEAFELNPLAPDEYRWVAATVRFFLRDFQGALDYGLSMENPDPFGRQIATSAHLIGDLDTAKYWRERTMERHPDFRVADWGKIVPLRNAADKQFVEDAMRSAGFP
ncbi:MAG: BTAD domain-containing putative transcriptional regulator [Devosia sp.]